MPSSNGYAYHSLCLSVYIDVPVYIIQLNSQFVRLAIRSTQSAFVSSLNDHKMLYTEFVAVELLRASNFTSLIANTCVPYTHRERARTQQIYVYRIVFRILLQPIRISDYVFRIFLSFLSFYSLSLSLALASRISSK